MIISPNTDVNGAYTLAENIRIKIGKTVFKGANMVTISAGTATISYPTSNEEDIVSKADTALYKAKENGRNRIEN